MSKKMNHRLPVYWRKLGLLLVCAAFCRSVPAATPPFDSHEAAVSALGAPGFRDRKKASEWLWSEGRPALPALRAAMSHPDPEIASRANEVVERIRSGILPGMPETLVSVLTSYPSQPADARRAILQGLLEDERYGAHAAWSLLITHEPVTSRTSLTFRIWPDVRIRIQRWIWEGKIELAHDWLEVMLLSGLEPPGFDLLALAEQTGTLEELRTSALLREGEDTPDAERWRFLAALRAGDIEGAAALVGEKRDDLRFALDVRSLETLPRAVGQLARDMAQSVEERLGYELTIARLHGERAKMEQTTALLREFARTNRDAAWFVIEVFLMNDSWNEAFELAGELSLHSHLVALASTVGRFHDASVFLEGHAADAALENHERAAIRAAQATLRASMGLPPLESDRDDDAEEDEVLAQQPPALVRDPSLEFIAKKDWAGLEKSLIERSESEKFSPQDWFTLAWARHRQHPENDAHSELVARSRMMPMGSDYDHVRLAYRMQLVGAPEEWVTDSYLRGLDSIAAGSGHSQLYALRRNVLPRLLKEQRWNDALLAIERVRMPALLRRVAFDYGSSLVLSASVGEANLFLAAEAGDQATALVVLDTMQGILHARATEWAHGLKKAGHAELAKEVLRRAQEHLMREIKHAPESSTLHNNLAWLLGVNQTDLPTARVHAEKAVALKPEEAAYRDTLAEVLFQMGETDDAVRLLEQCIKDEPDRPYFRQQLERIKKGDRSVIPPEDV